MSSDLAASESTFVNASASCSGLFESTYKQFGPPASVKQDPVDVITGTPQEIASTIGIPNPSNKEG